MTVMANKTVDISTAEYLDLVEAKGLRYQVGRFALPRLKEVSGLIESDPLLARQILDRVALWLTEEIERQGYRQE